MDDEGLRKFVDSGLKLEKLNEAVRKPLERVKAKIDKVVRTKRGWKLAVEMDALLSKMERRKLAPWAEGYCQRRSHELLDEILRLAGLTEEERDACGMAELLKNIKESADNSSEFIHYPDGSIRKAAKQ